MSKSTKAYVTDLSETQLSYFCGKMLCLPVEIRNGKCWNTVRDKEFDLFHHQRGLVLDLIELYYINVTNDGRMFNAYSFQGDSFHSAYGHSPEHAITRCSIMVDYGDRVDLEQD